MFIIHAPGIYLPNGEFVENRGHGHGANAREIFERMSKTESKSEKEAESRKKLYDYMLKSDENYDDFVLSAGFAIVASYGSKYCFKVAADNNFEQILKLKRLYQEEIEKYLSNTNCEDYWEDEKYQIWDYWNIRNEYSNEVRNIPEFVKVKDLYKKRGFLLLGRNWFDALDHDASALRIITSQMLNNEWRNSGRNAQDFLVYNKAAIQLGSSLQTKLVLASHEFYTLEDLEALKNKHNLHDEPQHPSEKKYVFMLI